jgi:hypothetical protein
MTITDADGKTWDFEGVTVKNISTKNMFYSERSPVAEFTFDIFNSHGDKMPKTKYGEEETLLPIIIFGRTRMDFDAGSSRIYRLWLNRFYDLTQCDTYSITVSRTFHVGKNADVTVQSDPIKLEITEPSWLHNPVDFVRSKQQPNGTH